MQTLSLFYKNSIRKELFKIFMRGLKDAKVLYFGKIVIKKERPNDRSHFTL